MHTITQLGPNSFTLGCDAFADIIPAFEDLFTNQTTGWSIYDSASNGLPSTDLVVRSLCADGVFYKYAGVSVALNGRLRIDGYESWNNSTHVGTNRTHGSQQDGMLPPVSTLTSFYIHVFVNPRWFAICVEDPANIVININNDGQGIFGIFEISRDHPGNTVGLGELPFIYLHTGSISNTGKIANSNGSICKPRIAAATGLNARCCIGYLFGLMVHDNATYKMSRNWPTNALTDPFTGDHFALELYCFIGNNIATPEFDGRVYGLKASGRNYAAQSFLDILSVDCDAEYFGNAAGSPTDHLVVITAFANGEVNRNNGRLLIPR